MTSSDLPEGFEELFGAAFNNPKRITPCCIDCKYAVHGLCTCSSSSHYNQIVWFEGTCKHGRE